MAQVMKILNRRTRGAWLLLFALALCQQAYAETVTNTYDTLNRLTSVVYGNGQQITYTYDPAGNRAATSGNTLTAPDAFTFTPQTNVALNTQIVSNTISVTGINAAPPITVSGGEYSINGGAYTTAPGSITNGQTVTVRLTSASTYSTIVSATLSIGGVSSTFNVTTLPPAPPAPAVSLAPTTLTFANQYAGTVSAAQFLTLTNTGDAVLNITSIFASVDFAEADNCGTSLAAGAFCTIDVTFNPSVVGALAGTLTIISDVTGSPHAVSLSGTGITPPFNTGDVTIVPTGTSSGGSWIGNTWTPSAAGSTVLASEIESHLALGPTVIYTMVSGNIIVNGAVSWIGNNTFVLASAGDIKVNANINITGDTAGLVLGYGVGRNYSLANGKSITLSGASPSLKIGEVGNEAIYTVINNLGVEGDTSTMTLQGMQNNLLGNYALGSNIDATATSVWNAGAGFAPVGDATIFFTGNIDGLGHTISNLTINRPTTDAVGLFGYVGRPAIGSIESVIRNVGLLGGSVSGNYKVGKLVGDGYNIIVSNGYATGTVNGNADGNSGGAGGLVGVINGGSISNSYAAAGVNGGSWVGGLVGMNNANISTSYATGSVSGNGRGLGGLAGYNQGAVTTSYATGSVVNGAAIGYGMGGLVGENYVSVSNSYATGSVSGGTNGSEVGGLVGHNLGSVNTSYATGRVSGGSILGGLVGMNVSFISPFPSPFPPAITDSVSNSYWDTDTSGQLIGVGSGTTTGAIGLTTIQMMVQASFTGFDFTNIWWMNEGITSPLLRNVTNSSMYLTPTSMSFASQNIGAVSAAQTVKLTNIGGAILNNISIVVNGDFAQASDCGASLGVGASCTISATFTPTATGIRTGAVTISSDAAGSTHTVSLSGTGAALASDVLTGHVRDSGGAGIAGVSVRADGNIGGSYVTGQAVTAADGSYSIPLLSGAYTVSISKSLMSCMSLPPCPPNGPSYSSPVANVSVIGATVQDFTLPPIVTLSGKVVDANGAGVANVRLTSGMMYMLNGNTATTGTDGSYSLPLYAGTYDITLASGTTSYTAAAGLSITANTARNFVLFAASQPTYNLVDLGTLDLGGGYSFVGGINDKGEVSGYGRIAPLIYHAFIFSNGALVDLGTIGGTGSYVGGSNSINASSQITGESDTAGDLNRHAFLASNGTMFDLGTLAGGNKSYGNGVNNAGDVVGGSETIIAGNIVTHAFVAPQNGVMTDLGTLGGNYSVGYGINNSGQVTGESDISGSLTTHAFVTRNGSMVDLGTLIGGSSSRGRGINATGEVVGFANSASSLQHAFVTKNGLMVDLGTLGGSYSMGSAINDAGQVVGNSYMPGDNITHAFVTYSDVMTDLNDLVALPTGLILTDALSINNRGQIVASGQLNGVTHFYLLTPAQGAPALSLSSTSLIFSAQDISSTSAAQSVTLTNTGNAALNIASIVASGDFARTTTCLATLAAGANCAINVTFTPTAAGIRAGSVTITSSAAGSPHAISLSGNGVATDITPPAVTALAAGGAYTSAQAVVLSANEPATIYYTLDGSVPTTASAVYSVPIVVGSSLTLKYFAVDTAGNASAVQSQTYSITIDTIAPAGTVSINSVAVSTNTTAVSLTLSATDNSGAVASMRFSNDGITWSAWEAYAVSKPWTLLAGNAVKTVHAQFEDAPGNISLPASASITLSVMPLTATPNLVWRNGGLLVGSTPLLGDDGRFYAIGTSAADGSGSGALAFNATDGTKAWGPVFPSGAGCTLGEMSMGANGLLYAVGDWNNCGNGRLVALNASNGSTAWDHGDCPGGGNTSPHPRQVPALDEALNSVYFGSSMLCSVDMNSGVNNWAASGGFYIGEKGLAVDSAQNIYYGSSNGGAGADGKISSYTSAGAFRWERALPGRAESGIVGMTLGDALLLRSQYPSGASTRLLAWDTNGNDLWFADNLDRAVTDTAGNIYASSVTGADIVALDFNGIERWRRILPGATSARLDFVDNAGRLYARGNNVLYALNSADGTIVWTFTADASLGVGAVLDQFGHILLADSASNLYLLDTALEYSVSPWPVAQYGNQRHTGKLGSNVPGTLSYAAVNVAPSSGTASTSFTYNVVYDNANNVAPRSVRVCIDALPCSAMSVDTSAAAALQDGNYVNGEQYVYTTSLVAGVHAYYFTASDGATSIRLPATGSLSGPAVSSLAIATSALPNGAVGTAYSQMLAAAGGTAPYTYSVSSLPAGLVLNSSTGLIYGTPIASGMYGFSVSVTDATGATLTGVLSVNVVAGSQTVSFGTAPTILTGGSGIVSATGGASGNAVTFSSITPTVCTVSGNTVTAVAAGACTIAADQAGDANYNAASQVTQTFTIGKANQTITFGVAPTIVTGGTGTVSATGGASGNPILFNSATLAVCNVNGNIISPVAAGICTITADQAGDANYNPATQVTQTFTIGKASQAVSFGIAPTIVVGGSGTVSATGGASGNAITFSSATPSICTVSGSTVSAVAAGACTIAADQAGDANYNPATQVTQTITIGKASQTVSFGAAPTVVIGGTGMVSATASSGLAVSFSSATPAICTVSGSTVTAVAAGACTIAADQAGDANYNPATQATQAITIAPITLALSGGGTAEVTAPVGEIFIAPPTVSAAVPAVSGVSFPNGTIDYTVTSPVGGNVTTTFKFTPALAPSTVLYKVAANGTATLIPASSWTRADTGATTTIALTLQDGGAFDLDGVANGRVVDPLAVGVASNVDLAVSALSSTAEGGILNAGGSLTLNDTVTNGGTTATSTANIPVHYYLSADNVITAADTFITSRTIPSLVAGASSSAATTLTIPLSLAPGIYYIGTIVDPNNIQPETNEANNTRATVGTLTVGQSAQAISFGALANHTFGDAPFAVSATASSGLAVSFSAGASTACTLTGNTVSIIAAGTCTLTASQAGDPNYLAAPQVMQSFTVGQAAQAISFGAPPVVMVGGTGTVSATGGASGNAVNFTSQTPLVCTVSGTNGSTVTGVTVGACTLAANQPGNANYLDAPQVTQTFAISSTVGVLSPAILNFPDQLVGTTSATQTVTLSNAGTAALTVGTITITGNFSRPSKTCGSILAAGSSCTISVAFAPRAAGLLTGTLTVGNNGTVALSGTGVAPSASITPAAYTFANQQVSTTSAIQIFTYSNTGPVPITVSTVALGGPAAANYAIASNACAGITLALGASCDLGVTFTPSAANNRVAVLSVTDSAGGAPVVTASLNGAGVAATATLTGSAAFGNQQVGVASAAQTFMYQNTGAGPFTVSSVAISGTAAANYAIASDTCSGAMLGASATCSIGLVFTPSATGNRTARLTVTSAAGGPPVQRLSLTGTGVAPIISLGRGTFRYGAVTIPTAATFTLTNTGTAPFVINAIALTTGTQFNMVGGTCLVSNSLINGNSCTLSVLFTPVGATTFTDTITVTGAGVGMGAPTYSAARAMSGR